MDTNEVSFSLPTWRRQEIQTVVHQQDELLYAASPYNLNDFKNDKSVPLFSTQEVSTLDSYQGKRIFNSELEIELCLFIVFLTEGVLSTSNDVKGINTNVSRFKRYLMNVDLCQFKNIPSKFKAFYKNELLKKIIYQYINKCLCNMSLIQHLLLNNPFLRFALTLIVRTVLKEDKIIQEFQDEVQLKKQLTSAANFFNLFVTKENDKQTRNSAGIPTVKPVFKANDSSLKSLHFLLILEGEKFSLYKKDVKPEQQIVLPEKIERTRASEQNLSVAAQQKREVESATSVKAPKSVKSIEGKPAIKRKKADTVDKKKQKPPSFWDCACCLWSK